ncbi:MAG: DEAD/DEAH box helicase [Planctomycetes bacterium]|nr:DEAD/DEAH box helicase [Planctomycetota bacterium]
MPYTNAHPALARAIAERGYAEPTPVQANVLAEGASGRDLLVSAQTGSGKTVAYGLAMAPTIVGTAEKFERASSPLALVIAPTRELALQVQRELQWLYAAAGGKVVSCVGGMDPREERRMLAGGAHIVVGTPGRLGDHLERGQIDMSSIRAVVLDEADEMLDLGFRDELELLLDSTPKTRRTLLFSATIPPGIATLAKKYQRDALRIETNSADEAHGDIDYRAVVIAPHDRERVVVNLLRYLDPRGALVFCRTREAVSHLHAHLQERGFGVVALSGELGQADRTRALQSLRDGRARVCVATDVAARGLDIPDLGLVLHADLPDSTASLQHRSGRTGRAGRRGTCAILVPYHSRRRVERLLASGNIKAQWSPPPTADEIRALDQKRLVEELIALTAEPAVDDLNAARELLAQRTPEQLAAGLVKLQRAQRPEPEELTSDTWPVRQPTGEPVRERPRTGLTVWFRMSVGRFGNADPRWIVPFICRRGHVTKADIGKIAILDRETRFEIDEQVAERFAAAATRPDQLDSDIEVELVGPDGAPPVEPRRRESRAAPRSGPRGAGGPPGARPPFRGRPERG